MESKKDILMLISKCGDEIQEIYLKGRKRLITRLSNHTLFTLIKLDHMGHLLEDT